MASQPSAVSCPHQPCLPTPRQPKCHLTWRTVPPHPATWPATAGSTPGAPLCPPTAVTSPPRWPSRACRQPGRAATLSRPPRSDAGAAPGAPRACQLLAPEPSSRTALPMLATLGISPRDLSPVRLSGLKELKTTSETERSVVLRS